MFGINMFAFQVVLYQAGCRRKPGMTNNPAANPDHDNYAVCGGMDHTGRHIDGALLSDAFEARAGRCHVVWACRIDDGTAEEKRYLGVWRTVSKRCPVGPGK